MALLEAIEKAAGILPDGWIIHISVKNGSAWVHFDGPKFGNFIVDGADMDLEEQVNEALARILKAVTQK